MAYVHLPGDKQRFALHLLQLSIKDIWQELCNQLPTNSPISQSTTIMSCPMMFKNVQYNFVFQIESNILIFQAFCGYHRINIKELHLYLTYKQDIVNVQQEKVCLPSTTTNSSETTNKVSRADTMKIKKDSLVQNISRNFYTDHIHTHN